MEKGFLDDWGCYIAKFRSLTIHNFTQQTYKWLEKGSIWPDVNQTAAAETQHRTSGPEWKKLIHINKIPSFINHKSSP